MVYIIIDTFSLKFSEEVKLPLPRVTHYLDWGVILDQVVYAFTRNSHSIFRIMI